MSDAMRRRRPKGSGAIFCLFLLDNYTKRKNKMLLKKRQVCYNKRVEAVTVSGPYR